MTNSTKPNNQEIDLLKVADNLSNKISLSFMEIINFGKFIKRNLIYIIILFILGAVLGYFYDKSNKKYYSNILAVPNFETVDYLYDRVELLNANINQNNERTLKDLKIDPSTRISSIEIKPVDDIYKFIRKDPSYLEVFKIMSENNDAKKVIDDYATSKNFTRNKIIVKSANLLSDNDLVKIMSFINDSDYFNEMRKKIIANLDEKIQSNNKSIQQIDAILNSVPMTEGKNTTVFYSDNKELKELIDNKTAFYNENHELNVHKSSLDYIVTPLSYSSNIEDQSGLNNKMKLVFPIIFVGGFFIFTIIRKYF